MSEPQLSEQDLKDLETLGSTEEPTRSLLEVWHKLLGEGVDAAAAAPISVHVASKVVASWPFLTFQETASYHELYHSLIKELRTVVLDAIDMHPDALGWVGENDAEHNHDVYKDILVGWHNLLDFYEDQWRAEDPESHLWVAVLADTRAFFFSQMGMAGHLDSIGFTMDNDEFLAAVRASREEQGE